MKNLHTLGVVVSVFDQWHGPIPILVDPIILRDNFDKLVELSDRVFSTIRFLDNFEIERQINFEYNLDPEVAENQGGRRVP